MRILLLLVTLSMAGCFSQDEETRKADELAGKVLLKESSADRGNAE